MNYLLMILAETKSAKMEAELEWSRGGRGVQLGGRALCLEMFGEVLRRWTM